MSTIDGDRISFLIRIALKSRVRRDVLLAIKRSEALLPIPEIARDSGHSSNQVVGALRGVEGQYDPELSLLRLQLVKEVVLMISTTRSRRVYKYTDNQAQRALVENLLSRYEEIRSRARLA